MSFANYTDFKAAFESWADNDDMLARSDDFIALGHARLNRVLQLPSMLVTATAVTVAGEQWVSKPTDLLSMLRLALNTGSATRGLDFTPPADLDDTSCYNQEGVPEVYTFLGDRIRLGPVPNGVYTLTMTYYAKVATLSGAVPSNTFLVSTPDLLLYACLMEVTPWLKDTEMALAWNAKYQQALEEVQSDAEEERFSHGQLQMRNV